MTTHVIIRIIDTEHLDYFIENESGDILSSGSAFHHDQLPEFPTATQTTLIVPGESVLVLNVQLPKMSRAQLVKALPYALEEQLIDEPEALHFVPGKQDIAGNISVAVVKKQLMIAWLEQCYALNLFPKIILPDYLAIPYLTDELHLYLDNDRVLIRESLLKGMTIEQGQLNSILSLSLAEAGEHNLKKIVLDYDDGSEHYDPAMLQGLGLPVEMRETDTFSMQLFAQGLAQKSSLNLLQGDFQADRPASKTTKIWKWAAIFLLAWLVIWLAGNVTQYFVYQDRLNNSNAAISVLYKKLFPNAQSQVDPRLRIQRALDSRQATGSGGPFLSLLTRVGQQLKQQKTATSIENFNYHNGSLILSISASNFQDLASLTAALRQQGLTVQQQNSATQGNKVTARLTVQGGVNG
jgi:general secretion pathway protein L